MSPITPKPPFYWTIAITQHFLVISFYGLCYIFFYRLRKLTLIAHFIDSRSLIECAKNTRSTRDLQESYINAVLHGNITSAPFAYPTSRQGATRSIKYASAIWGAFTLRNIWKSEMIRRRADFRTTCCVTKLLVIKYLKLPTLAERRKSPQPPFSTAFKIN